MEKEQKKGGILNLLKIFISCILAGGIFGGLSNMVNSFISPYYFQKIIHLDGQLTWTTAMVEGIRKGLMYGALFALIYSIGSAAITKGAGTYALAMKQLFKAAGFAGICWAVGGLFAILLTSINPGFYHKLFPITPTDEMDMLRFAWVGGSTWAGLIGGLLSAILAVVMLRNRWHAMMHPEEQ